MLPLEPRPTSAVIRSDSQRKRPPITLRGRAGSPESAVQSPPPDGVPRDCVMRLPTLSPDVVEIAGFDAMGVLRYRFQIEASEDSDFWQRSILHRMRQRYPARTITLVGG